MWRVLAKTARRDPTRLALAVKEGYAGLELSYAELASAANEVASTFGRLGVQQRDVLVTDLPNVAERLLLQLAMSKLGAAVATVRDAAALAELQEVARVRAAIVRSADSWLCAEDKSTQWLSPVLANRRSSGSWRFPREPSLFWQNWESSMAMNALDERRTHMMSDFDDDADDAYVREMGALPAAYFDSAGPMTQQEMWALGDACAERLDVAHSDRVCLSADVPTALGAMAACSAWSRSAALVLPKFSLMACWPSPPIDAQATLEGESSLATSYGPDNALTYGPGYASTYNDGATLLFADTHALEALAQLGANAKFPNLRGGVVEVGVGGDFIGDTLELAGVQLETLGKRPLSS